MQRKKYKMAACALALAALALGGCGGLAPTSAPTGTPEPTQTAAPTPTAAASGPVWTVTAGAWEGDVYKNESAGFSVRAPKGWSVQTEAALKQMGGQQALGETNKLELVLINEETGSNVIVMAENLTQALKLKPGLTDRQYLEIVNTQMRRQAQGVTYDEPAYGMGVLAGHPCTTLLVKGKDSDGDALTQCAYAYRVGDDMVVMTMTINPQAPQDQKTMEDAFSAL